MDIEDSSRSLVADLPVFTAPTVNRVPRQTGDGTTTPSSNTPTPRGLSHPQQQQQHGNKHPMAEGGTPSISSGGGGGGLGSVEMRNLQVPGAVPSNSSASGGGGGLHSPRSLGVASNGTGTGTGTGGGGSHSNFEAMQRASFLSATSSGAKSPDFRNRSFLSTTRSSNMLGARRRSSVRPGGSVRFALNAALNGSDDASRHSGAEDDPNANDGRKRSDSPSSSSSSDSDDPDALVRPGRSGSRSGGDACCPLCVRPVGKAANALNSPSFLVVSGDNPLRIFVFNIVHSKIFEGIVIVIILMNCVLLALDDPTVSEKPEYQIIFDYFFVAAFSVEMLLKMFALGVVGHQGAYLRSGWNALDFTIVILSYLAFIPSFGNYTALRTLRVLRPLRSMNAVPQLKAIVVGLLHSMRGLANVMLLSGFIFAIFGILAVQMWQGNFQYRCRHTITNEILEEAFCNPSYSDYGTIAGIDCPMEYKCARHANPNSGYTSFDSVYWAFLVIIQCITLEGWALLMYNAMDHSGWPTAMYFVLLVLIGSYFVLNLALAVINFEFIEAKGRMTEDQRQQDEQQDVARRQTIAGVAEIGMNIRQSHIGGDPADDVIVGLNSHRSLRSSAGSSTPGVINLGRPNALLSQESVARRRYVRDLQATIAGRLLLEDADDEIRAIAHVMALEEAELLEEQQQRKEAAKGARVIRRASSIVGTTGKGTGGSGGGTPRPASSPAPDGTATVSLAVPNSSGISSKKTEQHPSALIPPVRSPLAVCWTRIRLTSFRITDGDPLAVHEAELAELRKPKTAQQRAAQEEEDANNSNRRNSKFDGEENKEPDTTLFVQFIVFCIFANTVVLAAEHHNQSDLQTEVVEYLNMAFTIIFLIEMIMKLTSLGFKGYTADNFNNFDGVITVIAVVELAFLDGSSKFSVFRALRLLRVFRLLKNFPSLRSIVEVILVAVKETGYLNVIILLYLFIAALVGMQLFGGTFIDEDPQDPFRSTFNNFYWSFYTVFQVLTRDSWPDIMWMAMRSTHETASIYFLLCVIFGDFIILNLFLAILISSFDSITTEDVEGENLDEFQSSPRGVVLASSTAPPQQQVTLVSKPVNQFLLAGQQNKHIHTFKAFEGSGTGPLFSPSAAPGHPGVVGTTSGNSPTNRNMNNNNHSSHVPGVAVDSPTAGEEGADDHLFAEMDEMHMVGKDGGPVSVQKESMDLCLVCGEPLIVPFPTAAKHIKQITPLALHSRMCDRIQLRKFKEKTIADILRDIGFIAEADHDHHHDMATYLPDGTKIPYPTTNGQRPWTADFDDRSSTASSHHNNTGGRPNNSNDRRSPQQLTSGSLPPTVPSLRHGGVSVDVLDTHSVPSTMENTPRTHDGEEEDDKVVVVASTVALATNAQDGATTTATKNPLALPLSRTGTVVLENNSKICDVVPDHNDNGQQQHEEENLPTPTDVEEMFGRAWEAGLLLSVPIENYLYIQTWTPLRDILVAEREVLALHIGEEQVGRALIAYTRANVPREFMTNGGDSLWIFGPRNPLRVFLTQVVTHPAFDKIILACILMSSILMAIDNPRNDGTEMAYYVEFIGYVFTVIFVLEAAAKIIAFGFLFHPTAYIRDPWNILDFFIVIVSLVSWILASLGTVNLSFLKVLRTFRALRPLRVINRNRGIKMVVQTILMSIKGIANVALISIIVYLVFAILGVQLFAGRLYRCNDESIHERVNCTGTFTTTVTERVAREFNWTDNPAAPGTWQMVNITDFGEVSVTEIRTWHTVDFNFDNTYESFLTLFHAATLDNWGETMFNVIDMTDADHGPEINNHPEMGLYFVAFIVIGSFFLLNMFVGVIIFNFNVVKEQMDGLSWLTTEQKLWVETQRMMLNFRPQKRLFAGQAPIQQFSFQVAMSPKFEFGMGLTILLNIIFIGLEHYDQTDEFTLAMYIANVVFVFVFVVEAAVKIVAFGRHYFFDGWNRFDFFIVVVSLVDLSLDGQIPVNVGLLRVLRVFRIMRILGLIKKAKDVRILLETLWYSLPSLANIGAFLILIFFIYAVLGVQLFALVKRRGALTHHTNFEDFGTSFLFLVQVATLDNWGEVMVQLMDTSDCGPETNAKGWDDCGVSFAPLFFATFILMAGFVMVNLFVAIILDNFNTTMQLDKSKLKIADLKRFADAWSLLDPLATMLVETARFPRLLHALKPPLGIARTTDRLALLRATRRYAIPEHGGVIHFVETLIPLARQVLGVKFSEEEIREHEDNWKMQFPDILDLRILRYRQKRVTVDQYFASTFIASAFRRRRAYREIDDVRFEKRQKMVAWYNQHNVPEAKREGLTRMDDENRMRQERQLANERLMEEYALREDLQSSNDGEDDGGAEEEEEEDGDSFNDMHFSQRQQQQKQRQSMMLGASNLLGQSAAGSQNNSARRPSQINSARRSSHSGHSGGEGTPRRRKSSVSAHHGGLGLAGFWE